MAPNEILMRIAGLITALLLLLHVCSAEYKIGIGIADVTGPVAEIVFVSICFLLESAEFYDTIEMGSYMFYSKKCWTIIVIVKCVCK